MAVKSKTGYQNYYFRSMPGNSKPIQIVLVFFFLFKNEYHFWNTKLNQAFHVSRSKQMTYFWFNIKQGHSKLV